MSSSRGNRVGQRMPAVCAPYEKKLLQRASRRMRAVAPGGTGGGTGGTASRRSSAVDPNHLNFVAPSPFTGPVAGARSKRLRRRTVLAASLRAFLFLAATILTIVVLTGCTKAHHTAVLPATSTLQLGYSNIQFSFNDGDTAPGSVHLQFTKLPASRLRWEATLQNLPGNAIALSAGTGDAAHGQDGLDVSFDPTGAGLGWTTGTITIRDLDTGVQTTCAVSMVIEPACGPITTGTISNQTVNAGQTAEFQVQIDGQSPLALQWQRDGVDIPGANSTTYALVATAADDGAQFRVTASNALGHIVTLPGTLTVRAVALAPVLFYGPSNVTAYAYEKYSFICAVNDPGPLLFQWQRNGVNIPGATTSEYSVAGAQAGDNGAQFRVKVSNAAGTTVSAAATLTVLPRRTASFFQEPQDCTRIPGQTAVFSCALNGFYAWSTFRWQKNGVDIPGATTQYLTTAPVTLADSGALYRVIVAVPGGTYTSSAGRLTVVSPAVPVIVTQPVSQAAGYGQSILFICAATSTDGSLTFQWQRNNVDLPNERSLSLFLESVGWADQGAQFRVIVRNAAGLVASTPATLTVVPADLSLSANTLALAAHVTETTPVSDSIDGADLSGQVNQLNPHLSWSASWLDVQPTPFAPTGALGFSAVAKRSEGWTPGAPVIPSFGETDQTLVWTGQELLQFSPLKFPAYSGDRTNGLGQSAGLITGVNALDPWPNQTAVWTGTRAILWGGGAIAGAFPSNHGGLYDPVTDTWTGKTTLSGAPTARYEHCAVWTGTAMLIWGGTDGTTCLNTGARYDPATDAWTSITTVNAPAARQAMSAVWTGTRMIIWGGENHTSCFNDGAAYDPITDTWTGVTATTGAPSARGAQAAVWTGSEMIVFGGDANIDVFNPAPLNDGARYNPVTDTWTPLTASGLAPLPVYGPNHWVGCWRNHRLLLIPGHRAFMTSGGFSRFDTPLVWQPALDLAPGLYTDTVVIDDPNAIGAPQAITVSFTVHDFPAITAGPAPLAVLDNPLSMIVEFTSDIDPATITTGNVTVVGAGPDDAFGTGDDVLWTLDGLTLVTPKQLSIDLSSQTLPAGQYRLRISENVKSSAGGKLDGEAGTDYPTGDGVAGGDFVLDFTMP